MRSVYSIKFIFQDILFKIKHISKIDIRAKIIGSNKIKVGKNCKIFSNTILKTYKKNGTPIEMIKLGNACEIRENCFLFSGAGEINIGDRVFINVHTSILGGGGVKIGNDVIISPNVVISSSGHNFSDTDMPIYQQNDTFKKIIIEDNVWIGANCSILQGITIAKGSVIGAGSVVNSNIPENSIAVGNPAKVIKSRKNRLEVLEGLILKYFKEVPFHNLFMLYNIPVESSKLGGTCSDRTLHFKSILEKSDFEPKLHSAYIKGKETHRLLKVKVDNRNFFVDIGTGWATIKPFPLDKEIKYECYGIEFKSIISQNIMSIWIKKDNKPYEEMCSIPLRSKSEKEILNDIQDRYKDISIYPFEKSLRYSFIADDNFYFIRGNETFTYS